jgi:hypothetical protein
MDDVRFAESRAVGLLNKGVRQSLFLLVHG